MAEIVGNIDYKKTRKTSASYRLRMLTDLEKISFF